MRRSLCHSYPIHDVQIYLSALVCRLLHAWLNIGAIPGEQAIRQRRKKLEAVTQGNALSDACRETLRRLKGENGGK